MTTEPGTPATAGVGDRVPGAERRSGATVPVRIFLQARMSSARFPGKMLAPFRGRPLVAQVLASVQRALPSLPVVVATSDDPTDDPLARYVETLRVPVFRGPLEDVFERFRRCVAAHPCEWILRLSGDSPLLDARVLQAVAGCADDATLDLATTIFPRTWPKGYNAELLRARTFLAVDTRLLTADDREHVTPYFYRHAEQFHIRNIASEDPRLAVLSAAVDTCEDLQRLEALSEEELRAWAHREPSPQRR